MRINKFLASVGLGSRRKCDEIILSGAIKVNGAVVHTLGLEIDENNDLIEYNNQKIDKIDDKVYYIFNKPKGCVTTSSDDRGRKTVLDYFKFVPHRIFAVGRLDYNSTGLLLLTNDGDFANAVMHPKNNISKIYQVEIRGGITAYEIEKLQNGVVIDGKKTLPCHIKNLSVKEHSTLIEITIFEGRNREIRKMLESINKLVVSLKRTQIGSLKLGELKSGEYKKISKNIAEKCLK